MRRRVSGFCSRECTDGKEGSTYEKKWEWGTKGKARARPSGNLEEKEPSGWKRDTHVIYNTAHLNMAATGAGETMLVSTWCAVE